MTAAVFGWSPVIMIGRMPARFARGDRRSRLVARRIDHADQPGEHEIPLECSPISSALERSVRRCAVRDAERAQRAARQRSFACENLRAAASVRQRPASSPTSSCVQRVSSTSGAPFVNTSTRPSVSASRVDRAHQLALGRERHFADALETRVQHRRRRSPAFRAATMSAPSVGSPCTVQRPSCSLQRRVVGAVGDGQRALQFDSQVAGDRRRRLPLAPRRSAHSPSRRTSRGRSPSRPRARSSRFW